MKVGMDESGMKNKTYMNELDVVNVTRLLDEMIVNGV